MAVVLSLNTHKPFPVLPLSSLNYRSGPIRKRNSIYFAPIRIPGHRHTLLNNISNKEDPNPENAQEEVAYHEVNDLGVKAALSMLKFYKTGEISPLLPNSCRYVPTCSEYSMEAYKKYGVVRGTVLTAWRLCRCNPLGGSGFDPPRWFDERSLPEE
ncbi:hypothetical protein F2P56_007825 [Juglans regia]|uniref:Uncharacterized protein n=1 Tax=Juglans regia TaxID=51240 RepID=A0A833Y2B1_JUGRE|nr:hypothetical protein F2P56_007825 [Juglans regia]